MDKRELIEHINNTLFDNLKDTLFTEPTLSITESAKDNNVTITFETKQGGVLVGHILKKFEKVTIPQFVADWYEENKDDFEGNLFRCINTISSMYEDEELNEFENWVIEANTEPFQTLVNMHQFGYEVEKEKRYTVKVKAFLGQYLGRYYINNEILTPQFTRTQYTGKEGYPTFTRSELEQAGFGWVFDCPGIEIEEVEGWTY